MRGGCFFPPGNLAAKNAPQFSERLPQGLPAALRGLYFDTALSANPAVLRALLEITSIDHVLFGSDFPFQPAARVAASFGELRQCGFTAIELERIERTNAVGLMPGFD